jgi:hypothetical protein
MPSESENLSEEEVVIRKKKKEPAGGKAKRKKNVDEEDNEEDEPFDNDNEAFIVHGRQFVNKSKARSFFCVELMNTGLFFDDGALLMESVDKIVEGKMKWTDVVAAKKKKKK